ncbi:MAG: methylated-DNA--[protein]-cysteine S-methyltransferase [Actinobacteria bacterium]|nr:methylated-DNA--[protein]-cysteine S-methyltransferase [Actinomycetota bacterium]MCL5447308.1 methylated-DNA--[protein]-cysteine S-methyltransferase [Actinomycetota bacterium]
MDSIVTSMATIAGCTLPTPCGPFSILADDDCVLAAGFVENAQLLTALLDPSRRHSPIRDAPTHRALLAIQAYMDGEPAAPASIAVIQPGPPFAARVLRALSLIPPGQTMLYKELAALAGNPRAQRAAGSACARNKIAIFIPCHRAVPADNRVGGYAYGSERKSWLLQHECATTKKECIVVRG